MNFPTTERRGARSFSLRTRIILLFFVAIGMVTLLTLFLTQDATYEHSRAQLEGHQLAASRVVTDRLQTRATLLTQGLRDIAQSFSVKELVASGADDPESLAAAMENYRVRLNADLFIVLDESGKTLVSSTGIELANDPNSFSAEDLTWAKFDGQHYLLKSAPLRFAEKSRKVSAWLLMGQITDRLIDDELVALTGMQISLASLSGDIEILGSTLDEDHAAELQRALRGSGTGSAQLLLGDKSYVVGVHSVDEHSGLYTVATILRDEAYLNYQSLLVRLALLLFLAGLLAAGAAMRIAHSITRPIDKLVVAANRISEGLEATDFPTNSSTEVNVLSRAFHDMQSGIREREQEINRLAFYDDLTGLPNRNQFVTELKRMLGTIDAEVLNIALVGVDRFKDINDTVGHATGDTLLTLIAERLTQVIVGDDFLARLGGDEFAIVSTRKIRHISMLGEDIANVFEQAFYVDGLSLDVNVSIGLACSPQHAQEASELLRKADIALHCCKETHNGFAIYDDALNKHSVQRLNLMAELKSALAEGQLSLNYQPKLTLASNRIHCVECLIRWQHPGYGLIRPDDFIPMAEQTGAIRYVTQWALRTALEQRAAWAAQGLELDMAVNISAVDLGDMSLPAYVGELLSRFDLRPGQLVMEITESAIMHDPESAILALKNLQRMGVVLSIDDFGTGFSSMAQLKKMPVRELKIDKAFVLGLAENHDDRVMVQTLVSLAENLGLETVAEGVEDERALTILRDMGCVRAQGYHISRPLPAVEFEEWIRNRQRLAAVG
ncbi:MAG: EAL domain-containing protein [Congregibacter sp.]|nr:EAL domain-containing protein [Congregibacter sp.]